jgi:hypothetical protein
MSALARVHKRYDMLEPGVKMQMVAYVPGGLNVSDEAY